MLGTSKTTRIRDEQGCHTRICANSNLAERKRQPKMSAWTVRIFLPIFLLLFSLQVHNFWFSILSSGMCISAVALKMWWTGHCCEWASVCLCACRLPGQTGDRVWLQTRIWNLIEQESFHWEVLTQNLGEHRSQDYTTFPSISNSLSQVYCFYWTYIYIFY